MNIDEIIQTCLNDPGARAALAARLQKTLLPWEPEPGVFFVNAAHQRYCRLNLVGQVIARGHTTTCDMNRGDESLREQGYTLLDTLPNGLVGDDPPPGPG